MNILKRWQIVFVFNVFIGLTLSGVSHAQRCGGPFDNFRVPPQIGRDSGVAEKSVAAGVYQFALKDVTERGRELGLSEGRAATLQVIRGVFGPNGNLLVNLRFSDHPRYNHDALSKETYSDQIPPFASPPFSFMLGKHSVASTLDLKGFTLYEVVGMTQRIPLAKLARCP